MGREGTGTVILAIGKWGNFFAIRLSTSFYETLGIGVGDSIRAFMENDRRIVIEPVRDNHTIGNQITEQREWPLLRDIRKTSCSSPTRM